MAACRTIFSPLNICMQVKSFLIPRNPVVNCLPKKLISQKIITKLGLPDKPKRPLTPFFKFLVNVRPQIADQNKGIKPTGIVKLIGAEWSKLDIEAKKEFQIQYNNDMVEYIKKMIKYEQSLTHQQREAIKELKEKEYIASKKKELKKKIEDLNKPRKPANAFIMFLDNEIANKDPNEKYSEWRKKMTEKWFELPDIEKKPYTEKYTNLYRQYKKDLIDWEEKMIRAGHTDVVRNKCLYTDHNVK